MANNQIEVLKKTRAFLLKIVEDLSIEQLNKIPTGFANNIIWNLAHLTAAQQGVCYKRAGLRMIVDDAYFNSFKPDSKPEGFVDENEVEQIKALLITSLNQLQIDCENEAFANYPTWTTRYGVDIHNIDEAISFLSFHEGLHTGYIMALKRVIL